MVLLAALVVDKEVELLEAVEQAVKVITVEQVVEALLDIPLVAAAVLEAHLLLFQQVKVVLEVLVKQVQ